jgi:uroporphyrinogen-III synthase
VRGLRRNAAEFSVKVREGAWLGAYDESDKWRRLLTLCDFLRDRGVRGYSFAVMGQPLAGVRVATVENRYPEQLAQLLERQGATVISVPLLKETPIEDASGARRFLSICRHMTVDYIVFYTGVGVDILCRQSPDVELLGRSRIVARGPKAVNALKRGGIRVDLVADAATTAGIVQTLAREDLRNKTVLVQLYGRENTDLTAALQKRGATVIGVSIYSYTQVSDAAAVEDLVRRIVAGGVDAIAFTSATQVPFFFQTASQWADPKTFVRRFKKDVTVASVGEITSRALREAGVEPHVVPAESKMGPLVKALADFFEKRRKA